MHSTTHLVLWLLAGITGFVFGIFLASSLGLNQALHVFSLATFFAIVCVTIAYNFTRFYITRISGRMIYVQAGFIVLTAVVLSALLLFGVY